MDCLTEESTRCLNASWSILVSIPHYLLLLCLVENNDRRRRRRRRFVGKWWRGHAPIQTRKNTTKPIGKNSTIVLVLNEEQVLDFSQSRRNLEICHRLWSYYDFFFSCFSFPLFHQFLAFAIYSTFANFALLPILLNSNADSTTHGGRTLQELEKYSDWI